MSNNNIILGTNDRLIDRDSMTVFTIDDLGLTTEEIKVARVLMTDGWEGSLSDLIACAKGLDK